MFVVSCSVAAGGRPQPCSHTHAHTLHTQRGKRGKYTCLKLCALHLSSKNHFLLILPCPPFHLKGLWSRCISLNRPVKGEGWVEDTLTGVVPLASTPTTMTILMTMMTKMMTQKNAVLQSIWPPTHHKKVTFGRPRMTMRAVYVLLSVNHNFPLICYSIQRAIVWCIYSVCSGAFDVAL